MKRFFITLFFTALISLPLGVSAQAQKENHDATKAVSGKIQIQEGQHFTRLETPIKVSTGDKIEVREMFWYGCPHCNQLEPTIIKWLKNKPENAEFIPMPAVFSQRWVFHAKTYYTLKALGVDEKAHPMVFESIHQKRKPINNTKQLAKFLKANFDIEPSKVESAFNSFTVDSNMRAANAYSVKSGANGVPTVIVDGKFKTSVQEAGGNTQLFKVVDELVLLAQAER